MEDKKLNENIDSNKINNNVTNSKVLKKKRIGRLTFGLTLILLGISIFLQTIISVDILRYVLMMWPLIFISLGLEIIYFSKKDDIEIKYDIAGVIIIFVILVCTTIFSGINYAVNKILYNDNINQVISEKLVTNSRTYNLYNKVSLVNLGNKKVNLKIIEDKNYDSIKVSITGNVNEEKVNSKSIISLFGEKYSISNIIDIDNFVDDSIKNTKNSSKYYYLLTIDELPDWLESIDINIITNDKNNITTKGGFNII